MILVMLISGCAAVPQKPAPEKDPFSGLLERNRQQALEYEKNGELPRALHRWEIANAFQPADEEAIRKTAALKTEIHALADQHFKRGLSYYQSHSVPAARREFLLTLYYEPDHPEALSYVKKKLDGEDDILYEVKAGDTLSEIAKKVYNDPQKDFLIPLFNDLGKDRKLVPKTTLRLPILEAPSSKQPAEVREAPMETQDLSAEMKEMMGKAMAYFKANKFRETLSITEEILLYNPANKEAHELANDSHYQMGKLFSRERKLQEALEELSHVDPGYRDAAELLNATKKQLGEVHYVTGIKYYTEEKLDQAVREWEETLKLNPQHPKARGDIENALRVLQKLKEIK
jgi:tetratricopeptide (TPR) repeat protein